MKKFLKSLLEYKKISLYFLIIGVFAVILNYLEPYLKNNEYLYFKVGNTNFSLYWIVKTSILVIFFLWIGNYVNTKVEKRILSLKNIDSNLKQLGSKILSVFIYTILFFIILNIIGIDITSFAVIGGALSVGIGFGLQKITANFISGIILLFEKSINQGDLIELNDETKGIILSIYSRHTLLRTFSNKTIIIPNELLLTSKVTNWSYLDKKVKVDILFKISESSDIIKAKSLILEVAKEHNAVSKELDSTCRFEDFQNGYVQLELGIWLTDPAKGIDSIKNEIKESVWHLFRKNNIKIAVIQQEVKNI